MSIYVVTRVVTFVGAYLRTFWEHLVCRACKIAAEDVRPLKQGELCGHVEHEVINGLKHSFIMCFVPFTLNFIIGCLLLLTGAYKIVYIGELDSVFNFVMLYFGVSCLANCAPSYEDALGFKDNLYSSENKTLKVVLSPFFGVCYAMSFLERWGITLIFSIGFSVVFPYLFGYLFRMIHVLVN